MCFAETFAIFVNLTFRRVAAVARQNTARPAQSNFLEVSRMNRIASLRSKIVIRLRKRNLPLRAAASALAVVASIGIAYGALQAHGTDGQSQPELQSILNAIAEGRKVSPRVSLPLQVGFFDGATALYVTPEVGVDPAAPPAIIAAAKQVATGFNSNFIPQNFAVLPGSTAVDDIFVFTNFTQGNVLASAPHPAGPNNIDTNYSPLWQVSLVTWNQGVQGRVLTSQDDITNAAATGEVTIQKTPIIVECSVMFTPGGGLLPGARITRGNQGVGQSGDN
jgi:hypothetical protein